MKRIIVIFIVFFWTNCMFSQDSYFAIYPDSLKKNANAIIKEDHVDIEIESIDKMILKRKELSQF